jgi:hypothetical protein
MTEAPLVTAQTANRVNEALDSLLVRLVMQRLERIDESLKVARLESRRDWELALVGAQVALRELLQEVSDRHYGSAAE